MAESFTVKEGNYGPRLVLQSFWSIEVADFITSNGIRELELNRTLGWKDKDLSFLSSLPPLDAVAIIDWVIEDISPIHNLHQLKGLQLSTEDKTELDFRQFPNLERCGLGWRRKAESLFRCTSLKWLFLHRYTGRNIAPFANLINLEYLNISVAPIGNLEGLEPLQKLRFLGMHYLTKLISLRGIEHLKNLEDLEITHCKKIRSVKEIKNLINLRVLDLGDNGVIDTISPLQFLKKLERVHFYGSTKIEDGDLTPLTMLKNLKKVSFQERKHYTHKRIDFPSNTP